MGPAEARLLARIRDQENLASAAARKLHDDVGPTLTAVGFHLSALKLPKETLQEIREALETAMTGVRDVSNSLHGNVVEKSSLALALERLREEFEPLTQARLEFHVQLVKRYPPGPSFAVYRIVRESLANAVVHSKASSISVRVVADEEGLRAEVSDDGIGTSLPQVRGTAPGIGLIDMESISREENMKFGIESEPGHGTIVKIQTT